MIANPEEATAMESAQTIKTNHHRFPLMISPPTEFQKFLLHGINGFLFLIHIYANIRQGDMNCK